MEKIKFYSDQDLMCRRDLDCIMDVINNYDSTQELDFNDILVYYNILKYLKVKLFRRLIEETISIKAEEFVKQINKRIGTFISVNKTNYLCFYTGIDIIYSHDYFEVMDNYKVYKEIPIEDMQVFLQKDRRALRHTLENIDLVDFYDESLKKSMLSEPKNAEFILDRYLSNEDLYLPKSLVNSEKEELLDRYLELDSLNINQLRKIIYLPSNIKLKISDKLRLKAKKRLKQEEEMVFDGNNGIEFGITLRYTKDQNEVIKKQNNDEELLISIHEGWITENLDFNTLLNNFIHLYELVDNQCRLSLVSKENEIGALERAFSHSFDHLYNNHSFFKFKEMIFTVELISYSNLLNIHGIKIENMIEWFFNNYLMDEFNIKNYFIKMPSEYLSYFEKCRIIAPEIDRILKQYNFYIQDGIIDQELVQISSKQLKFSSCGSKTDKKYIYPVNRSKYYNNATFSLFSDQCHLFYLSKFDNKYVNLTDLIKNEKVKLIDFAEYQKPGIQWLIDNGLIAKDDKDVLLFKDETNIDILHDLFNNEVINYCHCSLQIRKKIDKFISSGVLYFENSLFSNNEQDYLDYYLNRSKFTNGYDLRNSYLHGTHSNDMKQHEKDYYTFLKIIIIIIIKINDDLCLSENK